MNNTINKIKILHIISGLNLGGAENNLFKICTLTNNQLLQHHVISLTDFGFYGNKLKLHNIKVYSLGFKKSLFDIFKFFKLMHLIYKISPNIVQTWMYHSDIIGSIATKIISRAPIIWNVRHGKYDNKLSSRIIIFVCSFFSKIFPKAIISCAQSAINIHKHYGYDKSKFVLIENGFDLDYFSKKNNLIYKKNLGIPINSFVVSYPARFHPQKNHEMFLSAAENILNTIPNVFFILCGRDIGSNNQLLTKLISKYKLRKRVLLLGEVSNIKSIYNISDLTCLTSSEGEAFPNIVAESMACEVLCISTPVGDAPIIINDDKYLIDFNDADGLANSIINFLKLTNTEKIKIGKKCRSNILRRYQIDKIINKYNSLYKQYAE